MIVHNPEPKSPDDPNDRVAVLIYNSEVALKKVSLFPELDREKAWPDFISLRSWTAKLIKELHFISNQRKRARAKIEERMEALAGCVEGSAEEVELRVLADIIEPLREKGGPDEPPPDLSTP